MVLCALCQVWQHAVCFGFLEETSVPNIHICIMCSKQHGRPATDPSLTKLPHSELQVLAVQNRRWGLMYGFIMFFYGCGGGGLLYQL